MSDTNTMAGTLTMTVTDMAILKIQDILKERGVPDQGLRVFVAGGGCSGVQYGMALEAQAQEGDSVIETGGLKFYVDAASAEYLAGAKIDYEDGPMGSGFRIESTSAPSCGCGDSGCGCGCGQ